MKNYCIVADATLDLQDEVIKKLGIKIIPMEFTLGDDTYTHYPDERELTCEKFYEKLKSGMPSVTTQITPIHYIEFFTPILESGMDIIYISLSSGLSGTYHTSCFVTNDLAEEYPDRRITCIDSRCASIGEGLLVYLTGCKYNEGLDYDAMLEYIEDIKFKCCHWFTVEDLFQLKRGGRISGVEAALGSALKIHPVLSTDSDGKLKVITKVRGAKKGIEYLIKRLVEDGTDIENQTILIGHANNLENALLLKQEIMNRTKVADILICKIGPVIGTHTGSGMLALTFVGENYKDISEK